MRFFVIGALLLLLAGCAPTTPMHKVGIGMGKSEVIQALGKPVEASGAGNEEYLWYVPANKFWSKFFVRFIDGRVESYGPVAKKAAKS